MATTSRIRSRPTRPRPPRGREACGGSGPCASAGAGVIRREVAIAGSHRQVVPAGYAHPDLHAPETAVMTAVGGNVPDGITTPDVAGNLFEGRDDLGVGARE